MFSSQKVFMVVYTHLSALLSFLNSVLFNDDASVPPDMLRWLFSESVSQSNSTTKYVFKFLPPLFCVSLAFGNRDPNGSNGITIPSLFFDVLALSCLQSCAHIVHKYFQISSHCPVLCSCQVATAIAGAIKSHWSMSPSRDQYINFVLDNDWIWGQAQYQDFETSSLLDSVMNNSDCPYSGLFAIRKRGEISSR